MELILEVIIYLLVVLGLITVCFTFFNKFSFLGPMISNEKVEEVVDKITYCREKKEAEKITMNVRYKNISLDELEKIKESIEFGQYSNIMDIVDEINFIDTKQKKSKIKKQDL